MNIAMLLGEKLAAVRNAKLERILVPLAWFLYAAQLVYIIPRHEPWADEAQAWMLAKDCGFGELFGHALRYEFSPGLWHALLWVASRMGLPYSGVNWLSGALACVAVALLTRRAPFPLFLRLAMPFTYFLAYQYAVVARSYVLYGPLLFGLAVLWKSRSERIIAVALLVGLLGNVSAHGLCVAGGLAIVLALEEFKQTSERRERRSSVWIAAALITVMLAFAAWCVLPPADADSIRSVRMSADPGVVAATFSERHRLPHWFDQIPVPLRLLVLIPIHAISALGVGMSGASRFGVLALILFGWRMVRERTTRYLIPAVLLGLMAMVSRFNSYHAGLIWLLFLFLWWVTWPPTKAVNRIQNPLAWVVILCVAVQIYMAAGAYRFDALSTYSPDRDAAKVLKTYLDQGREVDVAVPLRLTPFFQTEYFSVGLEPYFASQPFGNLPRRFWQWRQDASLRERYLADTNERKVIVVMQASPSMERERDRLQRLGYAQTHTVCGRVYAPQLPMPLFCHVFYEPR